MRLEPGLVMFLNTRVASSNTLVAYISVFGNRVNLLSNLLNDFLAHG